MASILRFSNVSSGGVIDTTEKKKFINFVIFVNSIGSFNPFLLIPMIRGQKKGLDIWMGVFKSCDTVPFNL